MISRRLLRIKIIQILYAYFNVQPEYRDVFLSEKDLKFSVRKTFDLYCYLLLLIRDVKQYAEKRIDLAKNKILPSHEDLNPNLRFIDNPVIGLIENSESLNEYLQKNKLSWVNYPELIRKIYTDMINKPYYQDYMSLRESDFNQDKSLLIQFLSKEVDNNEMLYQTLEEQSIFWNDDIEFVLSMLMKNLKSLREGDKMVLPELFKNEEDSEFAFGLFKKVILYSDRNRALIEKHTQNWDFERLAFMDMIIMQAAITEMTEFPSIPINVTLNEYIDIAKFYSTPKSGHFINGILDKISAELQNAGMIIKRGRGLLEK